jgi:hypothetical protein
VTILKHDDNNEEIKNDIVTNSEQEKMSLHKDTQGLPTGGFLSQAAKRAQISIWKIVNLFLKN